MKSMKIGAMVLLLAGCATEPVPPADAPSAAEAPPPGPARPAAGPPRPQLGYALPGGRHDCELGRHVSLKRDPRDAARVDLEWEGERYTMIRHRSHSGLPRYEHGASGLVWIELPWKGMLLDGRSGRPLANECRPA